MTYTKTTLSLLMVTAAIFVVGFTAQDAFAAPVKNPTNGNHYELISASAITWTDANNAANALMFNGVSGHLVTITNTNENVFVAGLLNSDRHSLWIGLTDRDVEGTFVWVTGEPVSFTIWGPSQPSPTIPGENYVEYSSLTDAWHDRPNFNNFITGYIVEFEKPDPLVQIFEKLTGILNAITGVQDTVDRIETTVNNSVAPNTERVSVTVNLNEIELAGGEIIVLLDTTGSGTLSSVHVAANLPCNDEGAPLLNIVAGVAGGDLSGVLTEAADNTGFNGPYETCVFHDTVSVDTLGHDITDVIIINPGIASDDDDDRHTGDGKGKGHDSHDDKEKGNGHEKYDEYDSSYESEYLEGVVITITGTYT